MLTHSARHSTGSLLCRLRVCGSLAQSPICSTSASTACISYRAAIWWLDFPGLFATAFGFVFVAARQMAAMAKSGLFPAFLHKTTSCSNTPYTALVGTSLLSLSCVLTAVYLYQPWQRELFSTVLIGSYLIYISVFVSYLALQTKYSSLSGGFFVNPLGSASAVLGIITITIFLLDDDISLLGFYEDNNQVPISFLATFLLVITLHCFLYVSKPQKLSEEQQKALFNACIINADDLSALLTIYLPCYYSYFIAVNDYNSIAAIRALIVMSAGARSCATVSGGKASARLIYVTAESADSKSFLLSC